MHYSKHWIFRAEVGSDHSDGLQATERQLCLVDSVCAIALTDTRSRVVHCRFKINVILLFFCDLLTSLASHDFIGEFSTSYRELSRGQSQFNVYEVRRMVMEGDLCLSLHVQYMCPRV